MRALQNQMSVPLKPRRVAARVIAPKHKGTRPVRQRVQDLRHQLLPAKPPMPSGVSCRYSQHIVQQQNALSGPETQVTSRGSAADISIHLFEYIAQRTRQR